MNSGFFGSIIESNYDLMQSISGVIECSFILHSPVYFSLFQGGFVSRIGPIRHMKVALRPYFYY